LSKVRRTTLNY